MKNKASGIFKRISVLVFFIITILSAVFIIITYYTSTYFYNARTQLLNKDVATHIAQFTSPFENNTINKEKADSVFYNAMVINPSIEVYFLDTTGKVMYSQSPDSIIQMKKIPLEAVKEFIASAGEKYVTGDDPKHTDVQKIFSAAEVNKDSSLLGYIYVILGSSAYGNAGSAILGSQVWHFAIEAFIAVIILTVIISIYYIKRLQHNYKKVIDVLEEYKNGNFNAQFALKVNNEFAPITEAFTNMSALLSLNMQKLQKSETDRKELVAGFSHDLQSPLSIVRGYAETMLMENNNSSEHNMYLKLIHLKVIQVQKMVLQLTELSNMEEINFQPQKEPFVLSEIVQETVKTYQHSAEDKKLNLECTQCQYHVWVNADIRMMERVIQNLVDNAVKNTAAHGKIQVSILAENQMLSFIIENTGNALPAQLLRWINSNELELSDRPSQAGLGLLIVKRILRLHNISLQVSRNDNINIFSFKIPVIAQPGM